MTLEKTRNGNEWTESRFNSFVKSALRSASQRWPPKYKTLAEACVGQKTNPKSGRQAKFYVCNKCKDEFVAKDVEVNHIIPVVPVTGWDSWDGVVERMFCEKEHLEVLCKPCHKSVTKEENESRKEWKTS
jgi:5-methylcytosine-specific restriction endonuclease McrA